MVVSTFLPPDSFIISDQGNIRRIRIYTHHRFWSWQTSKALGDAASVRHERTLPYAEQCLDFFKLFFLIPECGDKKTWFSLFQKPVLYHTSTKKNEMNKQLYIIKNSLELSASFIKKRFHVSISYSPTTFCWICVFAVKKSKMWGSSTLQTWTTLGILPWLSCGICFRSLP